MRKSAAVIGFCTLIGLIGGAALQASADDSADLQKKAIHSFVDARMHEDLNGLTNGIETPAKTETLVRQNAKYMICEHKMVKALFKAFPDQKDDMAASLRLSSDNALKSLLDAVDHATITPIDATHVKATFKLDDEEGSVVLVHSGDDWKLSFKDYFHMEPNAAGKISKKGSEFDQESVLVDGIASDVQAGKIKSMRDAMNVYETKMMAIESP